MSAIYPFVKIDSDARLNRRFLPYQVAWILAEDKLHAARKQAFALAEKSVRIGWTYADAFKNVRKRLKFPNRDYLFATKDYPSALEYMRIAKEFIDVFKLTRAMVSHGEDYLKLPGRASTWPRAGSTASHSVTEEIKIGYIKFDNGSRIIAFSAHPQAMAVYGGDVGLDEFAKHPNAELLWQTAQGRVTWAYDMAVWSSHEGDDTLFNQFAQQARLSLLNPNRNPSSPTLRSLSSEALLAKEDAFDDGGSRITHPSSVALLAKEDHAARSPHPASGIQHPEPRIEHPASLTAPIQNPVSRIEHPLSSGPWNLYFKVTITDAIEQGLLRVINRTRDANLNPQQFLADCRARAGLDQIFQQSYMCNPVPGGASIVEWSAIERCRSDYQIERVHFEAADITKLFGTFNPDTQENRHSKIESFLQYNFPALLSSSNSSHESRITRHDSSHQSHSSSPSTRNTRQSSPAFRLGFDIAASGSGNLCAIYIDEAKGDDLWLRALFTCRTEDWDFIKTTLFFFLHNLSRLQAAGDESGLGRQICWEASKAYPWKFTKVNFSARKQDLGFILMNQLSAIEKHFPKDQPDVAADFFALRKNFTGAKWVFSEGRNNNNPASHCDIAWAAALSSFAHTENDTSGASAAVLHETGWSDGRGFHPFKF